MVGHCIPSAVELLTAAILDLGTEKAWDEYDRPTQGVGLKRIEERGEGAGGGKRSSATINWGVGHFLPPLLHFTRCRRGVEVGA